MILIGDIGGTNTRLALVEQAATLREFKVLQHYNSVEFSDFYQILNLFLQQYTQGITIQLACLAIAGPIKNGAVKVTNLPWNISEQEIKQRFTIPAVTLINDFYAVAYAVSLLSMDDYIDIHKAVDCVNKDSAVIGAGTGLGVAQYRFINGQHRVFSSEAGHVDFAPVGNQQTQLLSWLQQTYQYISVEMLLSGGGLKLIYDFFCATEPHNESATIRNQFTDSDPAQVISNLGLSASDTLCEKALDCFVDIYAASAANVVLHYYPVGTVFIAGGIAEKIKTKIASRHFVDTFCNKGAMTEVLRSVSIKLITESQIGLLGALAVARDVVQHSPNNQKESI